MHHDDPHPEDPARPVVPGHTLGVRLGAGGSGTVWAATRHRDGAAVAVKVVAVGIGTQARSAVRELGVLARVDVEGLVRFHEAVLLPGEHQRVALVLDHVAGGSLASVVAARGHLSVGESVTVLAPVARALAGLHAAGVVHGDVAPGNVLLERSGRPLLADLGVAALAGEVPGEAHGTEGFVAPEVLDGGPPTPASDVYAAGALAWWCVAGRAPGPAVSRPSLESLAPDLPAAWARATARALSADPSQRPTAAEAALAWFDSVACEPLRMVVGTDETSLLTHRLRRPALGVDEPPSPAGRRRGVPRRPWRGSGGDRSRSPRRSRTAAAWTAGALATVLLLGALLAGGVLPAPRWLGPPGATGSTPTAGSAPAGSTPISSTPTSAGATSAKATTASGPTVAQRDQRSPTTDARALMAELASLRARVVVGGSSADLADLDAPGSSALARDTADLRRVRDAGLGYSGVRLTVRSARTTAATARTATVEAVVDTAAYRVVSVTGPERVVREEPGVRGQALRFVLVWSGGRWLVDRVEPTA